MNRQDALTILVVVCIEIHDTDLSKRNCTEMILPQAVFLAIMAEVRRSTFDSYTRARLNIVVIIRTPCPIIVESFSELDLAQIGILRYRLHCLASERSGPVDSKGCLFHSCSQSAVYL